MYDGLWAGRLIALGWALCQFCTSSLALSTNLGTSRYAENICCRNRVFWTEMRLKQHGLLMDPVLRMVNFSMGWGWTLPFPNKGSTSQSRSSTHLLISCWARLLSTSASSLGDFLQGRRWAMFTLNYLSFKPVFKMLMFLLLPGEKKNLFKLAFIKGYSAWKGVSCKNLKSSSLDDIIYININICRNSLCAHNIETCILGWHLYTRTCRLHFVAEVLKRRVYFWA